MASYPTQGGAADTWIDIVDVNSDIASRGVTVQNAGSYVIYVYEGGGTAPTSATDGVLLAPRQAMNVNAANVWVRGSYGGFSVAITDTK